MLTTFNPAGAPAPAFYSQAMGIDAPGRLVFVSGQVGVRPDGSVGEGIGEQTRLALGNLETVLQAAGLEVTDIAKTTIYLTDPADFEGFAAAGGPLLPSPPPATTLLYVKALAAPDLLVEIEAVAAR